MPRLAGATPVYRYLIVGSCAFGGEYATFLALYKCAHLPLIAANSVSFLVGLAISFTFNRGWSFKKESFHKRVHHQMILYGGLALANLLITNICIVLLRHAGIAPAIGKIILMACVACWNFFIFRNAIFNEARDM